MRRIVAACAFVGLVASVVPASHAAYTELSAANKLAAEGVIVDQSANPAEYRLGQNVLRQEAVGVAGRIKGVIPTTPVEDYDCQDVYSDVDEDWVCRAAELAATAKIVDPVATGYKFNPKRDVTRYEAMVMMMKSACLNPVELGEGDTHVEQTASAAAAAGVIASADAFDPNRAATRGEVFLYAAELWDYSNANPDMQDDSINGCGEDDELDLCDLLPDLPGCEDDEEEGEGEGGDLMASLSDDTPDSDNIPKNGRVVYTIFEVKAGSAAVEIDEITVERSGNGSRNDFDKIWLVEDGVVVTNDRSINSEDTATFTNLNWVVAAGKTRTFAIEAQMDGTQDDGKENRLNVVAIVTDGGDVSGLPIIGNEMLTINYTVAEVEFEKRGSSTTVDVGDEEATLGEFKLTNNSTEDKSVTVQSVRLENNGSADVSDLENLMLVHQGVEVSDRVVVSGDFVTFILDGGFDIADGDSRNFVVKADIIGGDDGDTYIFGLSDTFDLRGFEQGSGIGVTVDITDATLETYTVDAGRFSISLDVDSPVAEDYARGTDDVVFLIAKVDAGQDVTAEGVKVFLTSTSTDVGLAAANKVSIEDDLQDVSLMVNGKTIDSLDDVTCDGDDADDCYYNFDTDFELSDDDLISIVADIDDAADYTHEYGFSIPSKIGAASNFVDLEYVSSGDNVAVADISGTATGKNMTIVAATVQLVRNDGYTDEEFVAGVKNAELLKFLVDAGTSSDITVQTLAFDVTVSVCGGADVADFTGFKLWADGDQVGSTEDVSGTGATGTLTFDGIDFDIETNDQAQFILTADTDTSAAGCSLRLGVDTADSVIDDVNGDEITPTTSPAAATFSDLLDFLDGGELTASLDGDSQDSRIFVANSTDNVLGSFNFYANNDDIELKDLYFQNVTAIDHGSETKSDGRVQLFKLMVDGDVVATASPIAGELEFFDTGVIVPRNENVVVDIVADFNVIDNAGKTGAVFGMELTNVEARSVSTGFVLADADLTGVEAEGAAIGEVTTADTHLLAKTVPTLTSVDPISGNLTNGTKEVYGVKITADAKGRVAVYALAFQVTASGSTNFASPTLVNSSGNATDYTCTVDSTDDTNITAETGVVECKFTGTTTESISAGSSKTLYLKGAVSGLNTDDSLSVQMLQTANTFDLEDDTIDGDATDIFVDSATDIDAAGVYAIIWSDVASGNANATATNQWFGDNEVSGLDTATVTNETTSS